MANSYELCGTIKVIMDPQTFASGFVKREVVIETEEDWPQAVKFECVKQQCGLLDRVAVGERVRVQFRIRGNPSKDGTRYFVSLQASQIEKMGADGSSVTMAEDGTPPPAEEDDPMPF